jgi:hypothetical protein
MLIKPRLKELYALVKEFGGLDTQGYLSFASTSVVCQEVGEVLSVMVRGGGYIAAPSHTIHVPDENRQAMIETIEQYNALRASGFGRYRERYCDSSGNRSRSRS